MHTRLKQIIQSKKDDLKLALLQAGEYLSIAVLKKVWGQDNLDNLRPTLSLVDSLVLDDRKLTFTPRLEWYTSTPVISGEFYTMIRVPVLDVVVVESTLDAATESMVLLIFESWDFIIDNPGHPLSSKWFDICTEVDNTWTELEEGWDDVKKEAWQSICD